MVNNINMSTKEELIKNIKSFFKSAELVYKTSDYTSSCILYFKVLFALFDYIILISGYEIPKDHTERFRTLENYFPELYKNLDKLYPIYRNSYTTSISKIDCDLVRNYVNRIIKEQKIQV